MHLNKFTKALVLAMGMATFGAYAADQGSGTVTFTGSIIDAPCSISSDTADQEVKLGQVAKTALLNGGESTPVPFDIKLQNCTLTVNAEDGSGDVTRADAANTVTLTFNGASADTTNTLLKIEGAAAGAGVGITDPNGQPVKLGIATDAIDLVDAQTKTLSLYGYLKGLGKDAELKEGSYQAVSRFTLDYQ